MFGPSGCQHRKKDLVLLYLIARHTLGRGGEKKSMVKTSQLKY